MVNDLTGNRYGKLTVRCPSEEHGKWVCDCDCGGESVVTKSNLVSGGTRTCGCSKRADLTGRRFGRLKVKEYVGKKNDKHTWRCICDCGNEVHHYTSTLTGGHAKSCGCSRRADMVGKRFGKLTVRSHAGSIRYKGATKGQGSTWECSCDCGGSITVTTGRLNAGKATHCGCVPSNMKDISGQKFGMLTVVGRNGHIEYKNSRVTSWECECDCGTRIVLPKMTLLKDDERKSCGCANVINIKGKRFGKLEVLGWVQNEHGWIQWECACDCGNKVMMPQHELERGMLNSCGCDASWPELGYTGTMLYIVKARDRVKIGITKSIKKRLGTMQTWSPVRLEVIRLFKGATIAKERAIHSALRDIRSHGEWFYAERDLMIMSSIAIDLDDFMRIVSSRYTRF